MLVILSIRVRGVASHSQLPILQASLGGAEIQPRQDFHTRGCCRHRGVLHVYLPHGIPGRLSARRSNPANLEHLWEGWPLHPAETLAPAHIRSGTVTSSVSK